MIGEELKMTKTTIKKTAYVYISLPVICFLLFYMNSWFGLLFFLLFFTVLIRMFRKSRDQAADQEYSISKKTLFWFVAVAIVWSFLGGQGNLYYQSSDWQIRNAIYRDLIYRSWPVIYPDFDKALVYYIGYWLPPAVLTKGIGAIFPVIYETDMAFRIGNIFLWIWTSAGVFVVENLLAVYARPKGKKLLFVPLILVFFSGLDIVGGLRDIVKYGEILGAIDFHLEWWSPSLQFSSLTTCLFWVFNQTIVPWIVILCVLQEKGVENYVFMGLCAFAAGPLPFVGIVVYMLIYAAYRGILMQRAGKGISFLKEMMSVENWLALVILPVFMVYYRSNTAINAGADSSRTAAVSVFTLSVIDMEFIKEVVFFLIVEAGVYLFIFYRNYKNDIFYYITAGSIFIAPFIEVGVTDDFVMRFSVPAVMVLAAMSIKFLAEYKSAIADGKGKICCFALCLCLGIGAATPIMEFYRGYRAVRQNGRIVNVADDVKTLNQNAENANFVAYDYERNIFFRYLSPVL